jgi:hypothetical protein
MIDMVKGIARVRKCTRQGRTRARCIVSYGKGIDIARVSKIESHNSFLT